MTENTSKVQEIVQFLTKNPGYIKRGKENLASLLECLVEEVVEAKKILRNTEDNKEKELDLDNTSDNTISEFDKYLSAQKINPDEVKSVKYWQTAGGDFRFSVVTKNEPLQLPDIDDVVSAFTKSLEPILLPTTETNSNKTLVVYTSDKHIGAYVPDNAMYSNPYSKEEIMARMSSILSEIEKIVVEEGSIKEIIITDLGDALDGYNAQTTRGGHTLPQNMSNIEAFEVFVEAHRFIYDKILTAGWAEKITIIHLSDDNHSGEFSYFANRALEEYITGTYEGNITFKVSRDFIVPVKRKDFTLLLCHGKDGEDMKNGMPLYLKPETEKYIIDYMLNKGISNNNLHFIKGDLHQSATQQGKHFRYRNIPSVFGSSKWIMTNFGYNKPGCSFDLFEGKNLKQWDVWF